MLNEKLSKAPAPSRAAAPKSEIPKCLIVDDDDELRKQMRWALEGDFEVFQAVDRASALNIIREESPPLVTLDLGLPPNPGGPSEGFRALEDILERSEETKVIIISGQDDKKNALKAIEQGAYDFFMKPIQIEELKTVLQRALYLHRLEAENRQLRQSPSTDSFEGMLGTSQQMQQVFANIRKVASSDAPVLVVGESGTGKELTARAIHQLSPRRKGAFVAINCGAIPENLLESELFGYEKGAFTGAHAQKPGRIEAAQRGTLFLDEVGELPQALQVKLLRFLQDWKIERVGGRKSISVDCRILSATNSDLQEAMSKGEFREDLFYRLAVVTIPMPSLKEREGDVLMLSKYFLQMYADENRKKITGFTPDAINALEEYPWPGNIRELENRIRRAVIMAETNRLGATGLGLDAYASLKGLTLKEAREKVERDLIQRSLKRNKGNISRAAEELQVSRPTLYQLMEKLEIR